VRGSAGGSLQQSLAATLVPASCMSFASGRQIAVKRTGLQTGLAGHSMEEDGCRRHRNLKMGGQLKGRRVRSSVPAPTPGLARVAAGTQDGNTEHADTADSHWHTKLRCTVDVGAAVRVRAAGMADAGCAGGAAAAGPGHRKRGPGASYLDMSSHLPVEGDS